MDTYRADGGGLVTTCTRRRLLTATISHIHAQPPQAQKVSSVNTACSAWLGPVITTLVCMGNGCGAGGATGCGGAARWCAVHARPSK
jgi:hypothetical protein